MTERLDFALVARRCRSFRRLQHALEPILAGVAAGTAHVTP